MNITARLPSAWRVNVMYTLLHVTYWAMFAAFAGYQTALLLNRGFTSGQAGVLAAVRCLAGILSQPILGGWADRHPRIPLKYILETCLGASLAVNVVFYCTRPDFFGTALLLLALGALELNAYPLLDSLAVQFMDAGVNVRYSLGRGMGSFSYAVACIFLGRQALRFGTETVLLTHGGLLVALMLALLAYPTFPPDALPRPQMGERPHSVKYLLTHNPSYTLMLCAVFFAMTAVLPIVSFMVNIVTDRGGTTGDLGTALFLMAASELPAAFLFQFLWPRLGTRRMLTAAVFFMAVKPLAFLLATTLTGTLAVQPIQMLGYGLFTPASVYFASENVSLVDRVRGQSLMMMASNGMGGVAGNFFAGFFIDWGGVNAMLAFCLVCGMLGLGLALLSDRISRKY